MACAAPASSRAAASAQTMRRKARKAAQRAASASESGGSLTKPLAQIHHDGRGDAPDVMALIAERIEFACCALPLASLAFAIRDVQQERKRDFEDLGDFLRVGHKRKSLCEKTHYRQDRKAGSRLIGVEKTGDRNKVRPDSGFLSGLAQCRFDERGIVLVQSSAGKTHLT